MDVDDVAEELYRLPPAQFIAARDARAAEAKQAGDAAAARLISRLRKPTLAAWVSNLLARRKDEAGRLLQLAEAMRDAHRTLDPEQFRTLSHQQHVVIAGLAREAGGLAREAGQPVSGNVLQEVEQTLRAALADPEVAEQWATGRLTKTLAAPTEFPGTAPLAQVKHDGGESRPRDAAADKRRARLKDAMKAATEAAAELSKRDVEVRRAEEAHERATARQSAADEHVAQLTTKLGEADDERRAAAEEADAAALRVKDATRERKAAQRKADTTSQAVRRLSEHEPER
ncbi:hypothetical protein [Streptomyces sp. NPDC046821]|uniref:hypothetical protein n=1 Tax=Streptomyces sp. NPDC046821 TaxID=3154702 RepID=UPI0033DAFD5F